MDFDDALAPSRERLDDYAFIVGLKHAAEAGVPMMPGGAYAAPLETVVQALAAMVAHEFKLAQMYSYYAEMLKGMDRGALAQLFTDLAYDERRDATYFLRRLSALAPGGAPLPQIPSPEPILDAEGMLDVMIAEEQQGILMLQQLREMSGEAPMKYEVEARIADEQTHLDKLFQFKQVAPPKVAYAVERLRYKLANPLAMYEQSMMLAQAKNENAFLADQLQQTRSMLEDSTEQVSAGQAAAQEAQQQAQQAVAQADQAQQDALAGQSAAAEHANAKLRLAQRIQQMRQTLADLAAQDPVAEEGVGVDPTMTTTQQDQMAAEQAQQAQPSGQEPTQQPAAAAQQTAAAPGKVAGKSHLVDAAALGAVEAAIPATLTAAYLAHKHRKKEKTSAPLMQAAANLAKKVRPTQAISAVTPMAAAKHMATHNPALAIQAGRQGAPVVASPSVLEELSRTSFGKLSQNKAAALTPDTIRAIGGTAGALLGAGTAAAYAPNDHLASSITGGAILGGALGLGGAHAINDFRSANAAASAASQIQEAARARRAASQAQAAAKSQEMQAAAIAKMKAEVEASRPSRKSKVSGDQQNPTSPR